MNKEELLKTINIKINKAKIDLVTTTSIYRKRDIKKYIKKLEKERKNSINDKL